MTLPFRDPALPLAERVDDLIARLSLDEKVAQLGMDTPAVPRLGIPAYHWWNEALHGAARNGEATVFPQAIALAAAWDPAQHHRIATAIRLEVRAKHHALTTRTGGASGLYEGLTLWSPNINIYRDPRWGRGQETYGECPFLTSRLAVAFCRGLQGDDPVRLATVATLKHFAVHSGPEAERHTFDARPSARDLWETYLPAFEAGVREGGALSVMSAYNAIDGEPAPVNARLLTTILRGRWGFAGAVVGDVDCVHDVHAHHRVTRDAAESSARALRAGNDLCSGLTYAALPAALARGLCGMADLDRALRRLLTLRFRLGQFDPPATPPPPIPVEVHDELALTAARNGIVLLKNDGVLPLDPSRDRRVAVIGPVAADRAALLGNYAGTPRQPVTLLAGLRRAFAARGIDVLHEPGCALASGYPQNQRPFDATELWTSEARTQPGVRLEIWNNRTLTGAPALARIDEQVDLFWDYYQPQPGIAVRDTSARWSAALLPPVSGAYRLDLTVVGGVRCWLDGRLLLDEWEGGAFRIRTLHAALAAGRPATLRVELTQTEFTAKVRLGWRVPHPVPDLARALQAARASDHVILTLGLTPDLEGEENPFSCEGFSSGDRTTLALPQPQQELLAAIATLGKPVTLVLTGGGAIAFDPRLVKAALMAWYYGQRGADALAEILLGDCSPSGRLPVTFYGSEADLPPFRDYGMDGRTYRYFAGRPLYAFGHGLGYTRFDYLALECTPDGTMAAVTLRNAGSRAGDEVVQLYVRDPRPGRPRLQLAGFARVRLRAGETQVVRIPVARRALRRWDEERDDYAVDPVPRELLAGPASDRLPLRRVLPAPG